MSVIQRALGNLEHAIQNLDAATVGLASRKQGLETELQRMKSAAKSYQAGAQADMFAAPSAPAQNLDQKAVAQRLDQAIEKVEKILQDA